MILANSTVAERIRRAFPSATLLRVHSPPDPSRLTAFEGVAAKVGVQSAAVGLEARRSGKGERRVRTEGRRFWEKAIRVKYCLPVRLIYEQSCQTDVWDLACILGGK